MTHDDTPWDWELEARWSTLDPKEVISEMREVLYGRQKYRDSGLKCLFWRKARARRV